MGIFDVHHQRNMPHLLNICISKGNGFLFSDVSIYIYIFTLSPIIYKYICRLDNYVLLAIDGRLPTVFQLWYSLKKKIGDKDCCTVAYKYDLFIFKPDKWQAIFHNITTHLF